MQAKAPEVGEPRGCLELAEGSSSIIADTDAELRTFATLARPLMRFPDPPEGFRCHFCTLSARAQAPLAFS